MRKQRLRNQVTRPSSRGYGSPVLLPRPVTSKSEMLNFLLCQNIPLELWSRRPNMKLLLRFRQNWTKPGNSCPRTRLLTYLSAPEAPPPTAPQTSCQSDAALTYDYYHFCLTNNTALITTVQFYTFRSKSRPPGGMLDQAEHNNNHHFLSVLSGNRRYAFHVFFI